MIIFDLDGTLADCEHRRHFVEAPWDCCNPCYVLLKKVEAKLAAEEECCAWCGGQSALWKRDWQAFYEACDKDKPIPPTIEIIKSLHGLDYYAKCEDVHIWSGRSESVRDKTEAWLDSNGITFNQLKMRPVGDSTPDDELKERWLDEAISAGNKVDFVFDDRPKVVRMWRRRGIFVFNCLQSEREF